MVQSIVYKSNTGHTKQYAEMLSEILKVPAYHLKEAKVKLKKKDEIIFLGWICASKIQGLNKIKRYHVRCVGAVGVYPPEEEYINNLKKSNKLSYELFYLRGGIDYHKLTGFKKKMLKFVGNMMEKENKPENQEMIALFKTGVNYVSEKNLEPLLTFINREK